MNEIKLKIKGMMCSGCENRVKNALESIPEVEKVTADYLTGIINICCKDTVDKKVIKEVIEDIGFEIIGND